MHAALHALQMLCERCRLCCAASATLLPLESRASASLCCVVLLSLLLLLLSSLSLSNSLLAIRKLQCEREKRKANTETRTASNEQRNAAPKQRNCNAEQAAHDVSCSAEQRVAQTRACNQTPAKPCFRKCNQAAQNSSLAKIQCQQTCPANVRHQRCSRN